MFRTQRTVFSVQDPEFVRRVERICDINVFVHSADCEETCVEGGKKDWRCNIHGFEILIRI